MKYSKIAALSGLLLSLSSAPSQACDHVSYMIGTSGQCIDLTFLSLNNAPVPGGVNEAQRAQPRLEAEVFSATHVSGELHTIQYRVRNNTNDEIRYFELYLTLPDGRVEMTNWIGELPPGGSVEDSTVATVNSAAVQRNEFGISSSSIVTKAGKTILDAVVLSDVRETITVQRNGVKYSNGDGATSRQEYRRENR